MKNFKNKFYKPKKILGVLDHFERKKIEINYFCAINDLVRMKSTAKTSNAYKTTFQMDDIYILQYSE